MSTVSLVFFVQDTKVIHFVEWDGIGLALVEMPVPIEFTPSFWELGASARALPSATVVYPAVNVGDSSS